MPKYTVETKFFVFRQSNPGGFFTGPRYVIVEAVDEHGANGFAEEKTDEVYFYGASSGRDCDCCGDRWSKADDYDACNTLSEAIGNNSKYDTVFYDFKGNKHFVNENFIKKYRQNALKELTELSEELGLYEDEY